MTSHPVLKFLGSDAREADHKSQHVDFKDLTGVSPIRTHGMPQTFR